MTSCSLLSVVNCPTPDKVLASFVSQYSPKDWLHICETCLVYHDARSVTLQAVNVAQIPENTGTMGRVTTGPSWPCRGFFGRGIKISDPAAKCYQPSFFRGENCIGCQKEKQLTMTPYRGKGGGGRREGGKGDGE